MLLLLCLVMELRPARTLMLEPTPDGLLYQRAAAAKFARHRL
jgi:hypothetical protein